MSETLTTRTLLRFWAPESPKAAPQEWVGWWDGRRLVGAFGDGMWSPEYVTRWEPLLREERTHHPEWEVCADPAHSHGILYGDSRPYQHVSGWHPVRRFVTEWVKVDQ